MEQEQEQSLDHLLETKHVAAMLRVTRQTIGVMVRKDGLPFVWVRNRRRFDREKVQEWLDARTTTETSGTEPEQKQETYSAADVFGADQ